MERLLVTGGAGFIGSHLVERLLNLGYQVVCIDNFDDFYNREVKNQNISGFESDPNFTLIEGDIRDAEVLYQVKNIHAIIHLAARAGVRPSIDQPLLYQSVNVLGTQNLLNFAVANNIQKFVFASSSSVYGNNPNFPWSENEQVLQPISPYAATKLSGELIGHVYSYLHHVQFIALRFFTVFGPRQRPDLAINQFFTKILNGNTINVYGDGTTQRDYTYISDIIDGIVAALHYEKSNFEIFNLGNNKPTTILELIKSIEKITEKKAIIEHKSMQPGDVLSTCADITKASAALEYSPKIDLNSGLLEYYNWITKNRN